MTTAPDAKDAPAATRLEKARAYKEQHRDEILAWQRGYNAARLLDPVRRAKKLSSDSASRKRNYDKRHAYDLARDATKLKARRSIRDRIYKGKLIRGSCVICGTANAHAHHDDYLKPFEIAWLCGKHHKAVHRGELALTVKDIVHV